MQSLRCQTRAILALGLSTAVTGLVPGCQPGSPMARSGVELTTPSGWQPVAADRWAVPGVPLAAWAGPQGSSLVVYRTLPIPGGKAEEVVEALANRLANLPELNLVARRTETLAGTSAARVEAVAPGTGDALAPSGVGVPVAPRGRSLVATHVVVVGFPRPAETLFLAWHAPESAYAALQGPIEQTLRGLRLTRHAIQVSSY